MICYVVFSKCDWLALIIKQVNQFLCKIWINHKKSYINEKENDLSETYILPLHFESPEQIGMTQTN